MTHRTYLEQLLSNSIQKLNDFVDVLSMERFSTTRHADALHEWEAAENVYTAYLQLMQFNQINPDDAIGDVAVLFTGMACARPGTEHQHQGQNSDIACFQSSLKSAA